MQALRSETSSVAIAVSVFLLTGLLAAPAGAVEFRRGDANADGALNISDPVFTLAFLFRAGDLPSCGDAADANDDGNLNLSDAITTLAFLFQQGPALPAPGPACGSDPTPDLLSCKTFGGCGAEPSGRATLVAFTLAPNGAQASLVYDPQLGFRAGASFVRLHGRELSSAREIVLTDGFGESAIIAQGGFIVEERLPGSPYETIVFRLGDGHHDVRLQFRATPRDNLVVHVRGADGSSNALEIPVVREEDFHSIGATVSGTLVPSETMAGPVPIDYTIYDLVVSSTWRVEPEFAVAGKFDWRPALPFVGDPAGVRSRGVLAGPFERESGVALLPGRGARRTFVWDTARDPALEGRSGEVRVRLRLRVTRDVGIGSTFPEHIIETGELSIHRADAGPDALAGRLLETFDDRNDVDDAATTAIWGPPLEPGRLVASVEANAQPFGEGRAVVRWAPISAAELEPGESVVFEEILLDTDRMDVVHRFTTDAGTPRDRSDDITAEFLEELLDADGSPTVNPGEARGEFHFRDLHIASGLTVVARGDRPLVIRLSGREDDQGFDALVIESDAKLDVSGTDGEDSIVDGCPPPPNCGVADGRGGRAGAGGGDGGDGGQLLIEPFTAFVRTFAPATSGGRHGGGGGETTAAVHFDPAAPASIFAGAPGGGGGHVTRGEPGDYNRSNIAQYPIPDVGAGGAARGTDTQMELSGGSGGGGGGGTISRAAGGSYTTGGAGGGGGGGAVAVVARGRMVIDGAIDARGGDGGDGVIPHFHGIGPPDYPHNPQVSPGGAGGGGSGGSIVLRSTQGFALLSCDLLLAGGGEGGFSARAGAQNGGAGAAGRVRLEALAGDVPDCVGVSTGEFLANSRRSVAVSIARSLELANAVARLSAPALDVAAVVAPDAPAGSRVQILWEGATHAPDDRSAPGLWSGAVADPRELPPSEFVRFRVLFDAAPGAVPSVDEIGLDYAARRQE